MNLLELKEAVDSIIHAVREVDQDPSDTMVYIQINDIPSETLWSEDIELRWGGNNRVYGCVFRGWTDKEIK